MAEPADGPPRGVRDLAADLIYAGVGAVALTKERADELVEALTGDGRMSRADARATVDEIVGRWRGDAVRLGERAGMSMESVVRELGLVTKRDWEDLELRLAQVEHRLRLLERDDK